MSTVAALPVRPKTTVIGKSLSIYLDFLRLTAALAVFLHHANIFFFHREHTFFLSKGRQAVAVFFVLSGFVITFVVAEKERDWKQYARARISRLYSVTLIAILVTFLADTLGFHLDPQYYRSLPFYQPPNLPSALTYLSFTNQVWFKHFVFGTNEPFWSLGFEASYYLLFGLISYTHKRLAIVLALIWAAVFGPNILLFSSLWFLGNLTYKAIVKSNFELTRRTAWLFFCGSVLFGLLVDRMGRRVPGNIYLFYHLREERLLFVFFFLIGLAVALNLVAFKILTQDRSVFNPKFASAVRWLAGASFTLYLTHQPLLILMSCVLPKSRTSGAVAILACLLVLGLVLLIAEFGERRKTLFANAVRRVF